MGIEQSLLFKQYVSACTYPGLLDGAAVESALKGYLGALGIERNVVRIERGSSLGGYPALEKGIPPPLNNFFNSKAALTALTAQSAPDAQAALDAQAARRTRDAQAALDAQDAQDALDTRAERDAHAAVAAQDARVAWATRATRDAQDVVDARAARDAQDALDTPPGRNVWWWYNDISYQVTAYFGAAELRTNSVLKWSRPLLEAFIHGLWLLYWTKDTLYWVSKPTLFKEPGSGRLHNASGPALQADSEDLYFWHGALVPEAVILHPESIRVQDIENESNQEMKRVLAERYGLERYIRDAGLRKLQQDDYGELYRLPDSIFPVVVVTNSTPEADGTYKRYVLKAARRDCLSAHDAVASTFGLTAATYQPLHQS